MSNNTNCNYNCGNTIDNSISIFSLTKIFIQLHNFHPDRAQSLPRPKIEAYHAYSQHQDPRPRDPGAFLPAAYASAGPHAGWIHAAARILGGSDLVTRLGTHEP